MPSPTTVTTHAGLDLTAASLGRPTTESAVVWVDDFCTSCTGDDAERWVQRWRMFYMAVAEFFGYEHGSQWGVTHLLFEAR